MNWKTVGKSALRVAASAPVLVVICLALAIHFGALLIESLTGGPDTAPVFHPRVIQRAQEAPEAGEWPQAAVPCAGGKIDALRPSGAERAALADKLGRPDLVEPAEEPPASDGTTPFAPNRDTLIFNREIVNVLEVPKMPEGGKAYLTYATRTGKIDVDWEINPWVETPPTKPPGRFSFPKQWGVGFFVEQNDLDDKWQWAGIDDWDLYAFVEPLRIGRITWRIQAGVRSFVDQEIKYVKFGGEYRRR